MASELRLSCCHASAGDREAGPGLNARAKHVRPILNLEISAQCWHSGLTQAAGNHLLVDLCRGTLRTQMNR